MARLPQPGSDNGTWGDILNDYLSQSLTSTGTIKSDAITATQLADNSVGTDQIAANSVTTSAVLNGSVTEQKLSTAVQAKLNTTGPSDATTTSKGLVQLAGDLGGTAASPTVTKTYTKSDVGLANVDNTSDANKPIGTATQTALSGKASTVHTHASTDISDATTAGRTLLTAASTADQQTALNVYPKTDVYAKIESRSLTSTASATSPTPNGSAITNLYFLTAQATPVSFGVPSGTAADGNALIIRVKDNGTARAITWNAIYKAVGITLPTTTVAGKTLYIAALYNAADTKWDVIDTRQEA